MKTFVVALTLLTPAYSDSIVILFVKNGWSIEPMYADNRYMVRSGTCSVFGAKVHVPAGAPAAIQRFTSEIAEQLNDAGVKYHSIMVSDACPGAMWAGNIDLSKDKGPYR